MLVKWYAVIQYWFLAHEDALSLEQFYAWPRGTVKTVARNIRRAIAGDRQDGKQRTGRARGRPKKIPASSTVLVPELA